MNLRIFCLFVFFHSRLFSPPIFPTPYTNYPKTTHKSPSNIYSGRNRFERLTPDKRKYLSFLEKSKILRRVGSHSAANSCESRHLCELGIAAVIEKSATKSAHTLYKALWRISNEYDFHINASTSFIIIIMINSVFVIPGNQIKNHWMT